MQENYSKKYPDIYYASEQDKTNKRQTRMKYVEDQGSRKIWSIGKYKIQGWRK